MEWREWYDALAKPEWTPSPQFISTMWMLLYPIIFVTFAYVILQAIRGALPWSVAAPFAINFVANLLFTPIMFGLRNPPLASVDILIVLITIVWMMIAVWPHAKWIALLQIPYLAWVSVATVLQLSITAMNWGR